MKIEGATSEDVFDYLFYIGAKKGKRYVYMVYLKNGI